MTVSACVTRLQTLADGISSIRFAPSTLPDSLPGFPAAVSYLSSFDAERYTGANARTVWVATTEIHVARKDLPRDYATLDDIAEEFVTAVLGDITLNGNASTVINVNGSLQASSWAAQDTLAWVCQTTFKINAT